LQKKENRLSLNDYLKLIRKSMETPEKKHKENWNQTLTQKNIQNTLLTLQEKPIWKTHRIRNNDQTFRIKVQIPFINYGKTITLDNNFRDIFQKISKNYISL